MTFDPFQRRVKDEMTRDVVAIKPTALLLVSIEQMEYEGVTTCPLLTRPNALWGSFRHQICLPHLLQALYRRRPARSFAGALGRRERVARSDQLSL